MHACMYVCMYASPGLCSQRFQIPCPESCRVAETLDNFWRKIHSRGRKIHSRGRTTLDNFCRVAETLDNFWRRRQKQLGGEIHNVSRNRACAQYYYYYYYTTTILLYYTTTIYYYYATNFNNNKSFRRHGSRTLAEVARLVSSGVQGRRSSGQNVESIM